MTKMLTKIKNLPLELHLLVQIADIVMQMAKSTFTVVMVVWATNELHLMTSTASTSQPRSGKDTNLLLGKPLFQMVVAETVYSLQTINYTHLVVGTVKRSSLTQFITISTRKSGLIQIFWLIQLGGTIHHCWLKRFLPGNISFLAVNQQILLKDKLVPSVRLSTLLPSLICFPLNGKKLSQKTVPICQLQESTLQCFTKKISLLFLVGGTMVG